MNPVHFGQRTLMIYKKWPRLPFLMSEDDQKLYGNTGMGAFDQLVKREETRLRQGKKNVAVKVFPLPSMTADEQGNVLKADGKPLKDGMFFIRQLLVVSGKKDIAKVEQELYGGKGGWLWLQAFKRRKTDEVENRTPLMPTPTPHVVKLDVDVVKELQVSPGKKPRSRRLSFSE